MAARRTKAQADAEAEAEAIKLRTAGLTFRQIADKQRVTVGTAYKRVSRALAAIPAEAVEEHRKLALEQLDAVIAKCWDIVQEPHPYVSQGRVFPNLEDRGPVLQALSLIMRTIESKRKLLGLDAPTRRVQEVITESVVDAELRRLEGELAGNDASPAPVESRSV